jgi:hypothetical protein
MLNNCMRLYEFEIPTDTLLSYWDLVNQLGLKKHADKFHDAVLPWVNNNSPSCINKLITNKKYRELSMLDLFFQVGLHARNRGKPITTLEAFNAFRKLPITLWRAGGGHYDPSIRGNGWFAYTFSKDRVRTFSDYEGTYASKSFSLNKRVGNSWIIELTIPVSQILLYLQPSMDSEVIISAELSSTANVIQQT